jgi:adenylate cyclase
MKGVMMEMSRKTKFNLFIGFSITLLVALFMFIELPPMETLEEKLYDYRFKIRGTIQPPENIVIAAIDEKSLGKLGRWPWSRDKIARLVNRLSEEGPEIIILDMILSETEKNDKALGQAIQKAGNVILPVVFEFDRESHVPESESLLNSAFRSVVNAERFKQYSPITAKRPLTPVSELIRETMALGHINMFPDRDGTLRWEAMAIEHHGYLFPSIDLQTAAIYLGVPHEKITLNATEGVHLGEKRTIPTDRYSRSLIHYYGPWQTFKYFSIADILEGEIKPGALQGKIVLVGATAVGIYDLRVTPFSAAMPGVEKHASVISSILENRFLRRANFSTNLILLLISGSLFSFLITRFKSMGATFTAGIFLVIVLGSGYFLFVHQGLWINMAYPSNNILLIFISVMVYNYAIEEKMARKIRAMFSSYVTEKVVNELIKNPDMAKLGGERRTITVLFSDVVGFTSFSEKYTPEEVVALLNEYLGAMTEVIFRWEGTLDKFVGDAIVAFWGAPMRQENHAELAVRCALNMVKRLEDLQEKWRSEGKPILDSGIGINTGEVLVGNIGAERKKMDYTVIGDHVNLGSRVEGLTRKYHTHILITEYTLDHLRNFVNSRLIGHIVIKGRGKTSVKGREKSVRVYEVQSIEHGLKSEIQESDEREKESNSLPPSVK